MANPSSSLLATLAQLKPTNSLLLSMSTNQNGLLLRSNDNGASLRLSSQP